MTATEPDALTDAEAGAVLLALGSQLEWRDNRDWEGTAFYDGLIDDTLLYRLTGSDGHWDIETPHEELSTSHNTVQDAKLACERHLATGKWA